MKKDTMKRLMALPQDAQEKVLQLAKERLKQGKTPKSEAPGPQGRKKHPG